MNTPSWAPRTLALCSGYGGLELALAQGLGGRVVGFAENDPYAAAVFAAHHPGAPNLGDITSADWHQVREVFAPDVVAAGFPCRNISNAGRRDGINGQWSRVWKDVVAAVRVVRPRVVFLENVAAIRSRGLDIVAEDLAQVGYDARWTCLRASDREVGAPHARDRWFCLAHPADADPDHIGRHWRTGHLPEARGWAAPAHAGHAPAGTADASVRLLPTPKASDGPHGGPNQRDTQGRYYLPGQAVRLDHRWIAHDGTDYGPGIRRWEHVTGHAAPCPTEAGTRGNRRLSPAFAEWLMGLTPGHVTGRGLPRKEELKILGNGVVPQQAHHAYGLLLGAAAQQLDQPGEMAA